MRDGRRQLRGAQVSEWIGRNSQRKETLVKKGERTKEKKVGFGRGRSKITALILICSPKNLYLEEWWKVDDVLMKKGRD